MDWLTLQAHELAKWLGSADPAKVLGYFFSGLAALLALYLKYGGITRGFLKKAAEIEKGNPVSDDKPQDHGTRYETVIKHAREERADRLAQALADAQELIRRQSDELRAAGVAIEGLRREIKECHERNAELSGGLAALHAEVARLRPVEDQVKHMVTEVARSTGVTEEDVRRRLPPPAPRTPGSRPAWDPVTVPPEPPRTPAVELYADDCEPTPPRATALPPLPKKRTEWPL